MARHAGEPQHVLCGFRSRQLPWRSTFSPTTTRSVSAALPISHAFQAAWLYSMAFFQYTEVGKAILQDCLKVASLFGVEMSLVVGGFVLFLARRAAMKKTGYRVAGDDNDEGSDEGSDEVSELVRGKLNAHCIPSIVHTRRVPTTCR